MKVGLVRLGTRTEDLAGPDCPLPALASALVGHGHDVTVLARRQSPRDPGWLRAADFEVRQLAAGRASTLPDSDAIEVVEQFVHGLAAAVRDGEFDVLHSHDWLAGLASHIVPGPAHPPTVQSFHWLGQMERLRGFGSSARWVPGSRLRMERAVAARADHLIAESSQERDALIGLGVARSRITVVPTGAAAPPADSMADRPARPDTRRVVLFAAPELCASAVRALVELPDTELVLCVSGEDERRPAETVLELGTQLSVGDRVRLQPWRATPAERAPLLEAADVVLCQAPSAEVGPVHLEAMRVGVPVIAANPESAEAVVDGVTGVRLTDPSPSSLAAHIRALLANPAVRQSMSAAACDRVASRYSWERIAAETGRVYESVRDRRRTAEQIPGTRHPAPGTRHPAPGTRHPAPGTRHPAPGTRHPEIAPDRRIATTTSGRAGGRSAARQ